MKDTSYTVTSSTETPATNRLTKLNDAKAGSRSYMLTFHLPRRPLGHICTLARIVCMCGLIILVAGLVSFSSAFYVAAGADINNTVNMSGAAHGRFMYFAFGSNLLKERLQLANPSATFCTTGRLKVSNQVCIITINLTYTNTAFMYM